MRRTGTIIGLGLWLMLAPVSANCQATKRQPELEHFAFAAAVDNLDGPRLEALAPIGYRLITNDAEGNVYFTCKYTTSWIRCVRTNGQIETIAGDDHWTVEMNLAEGPAVHLPNFGRHPSAGENVLPGIALTAYGRPLHGEEHGCLYLFWPGQVPCKIFRNKQQNNRWWFRRLGGPGKPKPPTELGKSASVYETDMTDARIGLGWVEWHGHLYRFDESKGLITCILRLEDYQDQVEAALPYWHDKNVGRRIGPPEFLQLAEDGTVYLLYYHKTYFIGGQVFRISPDRKQCELIVADRARRKGQNLDGDGLTTTWHCGPAMILVSANELFLLAIDSNVVRRWKDGRVATLFLDGEWREVPAKVSGVGTVRFNGYAPAQYGLPYIYIFYPGEDTFGDIRAFRFGPVDFHKPAISSGTK
ncbi:MAG: hypothetical protein RMJ19_14535 [Gemmatales bacterium]|nr:hypothetical protein [Gemmatales bacterium]MCS7161685.1 hypothetical protein [Gemmatales bacterium]MDW8176888.1 hypothetical protein [Gemmatales bacterium]MDW8222710.1 hypothetical protein [Gemmatales bacterium]